MWVYRERMPVAIGYNGLLQSTAQDFCLHFWFTAKRLATSTATYNSLYFSANLKSTQAYRSQHGRRDSITFKNSEETRETNSGASILPRLTMAISFVLINTLCTQLSQNSNLVFKEFWSLQYYAVASSKGFSLDAVHKFLTFICLNLDRAPGEPGNLSAAKEYGLLLLTE